MTVCDEDQFKTFGFESLCPEVFEKFRKPFEAIVGSMLGLGSAIVGGIFMSSVYRCARCMGVFGRPRVCPAGCGV